MQFINLWYAMLNHMAILNAITFTKNKAHTYTHMHKRTHANREHARRNKFFCKQMIKWWNDEILNVNTDLNLEKAKPSHSNH